MMEGNGVFDLRMFSDSGATYVVISDEEGCMEVAFHSAATAGKTLVVPSIAVDDDGQRYTVTQFGYCSGEGSAFIPVINERISRIVLPPTVRIIGNFSAKGLQSFVMTDHVTSVADNTFAGCSELRDVVMSRQLTSIPKGMFNECYALESVVIPEGVREIGENAFRYCENLRSIVLPSGLKSISDGAFLECGALKCVYLPPTLESIGDAAFMGCRTLVSLDVPDSVTSIGRNAFHRCLKLRSIRMGKGMECFPSDILHPAPAVRSVVLGDNVRSIEKETFRNWHRLTDVVLPESLSTIGECAFEGCSSLREIVLPSNVSCVERDSFKGCESLVGIHVNGMNEVYSSYGGCLLCPGLNMLVRCPEGMEGKVTVPDGIVDLAECAFENCQRITHVEIPDSVSIVGWATFCNCTSLESVRLGENVPQIPYEMFSGCIDLKYVEFGPKVWNIGQESFNGCVSLKEICIPDSVEEIERHAFRGCISLERVRIGSSVSFIAAYAFLGCRSLSNVDVDPDNEHFVSVDGVVYTKDMKELVLVPPGWKGRSFTVPRTVECIRIGAFAGCRGIEELSVEDGNAYYASVDGILYTSDMMELVRHPSTDEDVIRLKDGLTHIRSDAFSGTSVEAVRVPEGVFSIGMYAFYDCQRLEYVTLPKSLRVIEENAFRRCTALDVLFLTGFSESIDIGEEAFSLCNVGVEPVSHMDGWSFDAYELDGTLRLDLPDTGLRDFEGILAFDWYEVDDDRPSGL